MALTKRGKHWFGESQADIRTELLRFSKVNEEEAHHFADAICTCGGRVFGLEIDEDAGAAVRKCTACRHLHAIGDSDEFLDEAELQECACPCGLEAFEITAGVSVYEATDDVKWLYIGCRCPGCGLTATYGHWKNEFLGYQKLLERV